MADQPGWYTERGVHFEAQVTTYPFPGIPPTITLAWASGDGSWRSIDWSADRLDDLIGTLERLANHCRRHGIPTRNEELRR